MLLFYFNLILFIYLTFETRWMDTWLKQGNHIPAFSNPCLPLILITHLGWMCTSPAQVLFISFVHLVCVEAY